MNQKRIILSFISLLWVNILPYISRLPYGMEWVKQYFPSSSHALIALLFFHSFYSIASIPILLSLNYSTKDYSIFLGILCLVSFLTWNFHSSYDLSSDAQAAIGLIVFPIHTAIIGTVALGTMLLIRRFIIPKIKN